MQQHSAPYQPYRKALYSRDELMEGWEPGDTHAATRDAAIYEHFKRCGGRAPEVGEGLVQRIHDHSVDVALAAFLTQHPKVVGIMGSSRMPATDPFYGLVAELAFKLANEGFLVATGGGLGIMEAANLGAFLSDRSAATVEEAVRVLAGVGTYADNEAAHLQAAAELRVRHDPGRVSLAVPTWVYPGEPISQFGTHIAKYFSNSIREDGLLAICTAGIVFAPGRAGTAQEIFQDAAQNSYEVFGGRSPMAFLGTDWYTEHTQLYPTLRRQAELHGGYQDLVGLFDDADSVVDFLRLHQPAGAIDRARKSSTAEMLAWMKNERAVH